jgi:hypothetical protein
MAGAYAAFKKRAYLLIEVQPGNEEGLVRQLEELPSVVTADFVHGSCDFVCVLEGEYKDMDETVLQVRRLPHVRKTTTLTVFDMALQ